MHSQDEKEREAGDVEVSLSPTLVQVTVDLGVQGDARLRQVFAVFHHGTNGV